MNQPGFGTHPASPNTTYVQADPSNFRAVVQKLTGAPEDPSSPRLPITLPPRFTTPKPDVGPRRPAFKLHERRHAVKKLELNLAAAAARALRCADQVVASPVSTLEFLARRTPRQLGDEEEEEEDDSEEVRAIAEKRFYLHPSPINTPRPGSGSEAPELLVLFPLHSPRDTHRLHSLV